MALSKNENYLLHCKESKSDYATEVQLLTIMFTIPCTHLKVTIKVNG